MNTLQSIEKGRAIFGTSDGLQAFGNGILEDVAKNPWIFEFEKIGRLRDSPLRKFSIETPVLFCRQLTDNQGNSAVIVGVIAPCMDAHSRPGFLGACVALSMERLNGKVNIAESWEAVLNEIETLYFDYAIKMVHPSNNVLHLKQILKPMPSYKRYHWKHNSADECLIYYDNDEHGYELVCDSLQAISLFYGNEVPSFLLFPEYVPNSISIQADWIKTARKNLAEAKTLATLAPQELASPEGTQEQPTTEDLELYKQIQKLQTDITSLQAQIAEMQYELNIQRSRRYSTNTSNDSEFGIFSSQNKDHQRKILYRFGLLGLVSIILVLIVVLGFWLLGTNDDDTASLKLNGDQMLTPESGDVSVDQLQGGK